MVDKLKEIEPFLVENLSRYVLSYFIHKYVIIEISHVIQIIYLK